MTQARRGRGSPIALLLAAALIAAGPVPASAAPARTVPGSVWVAARSGAVGVAGLGTYLGRLRVSPAPDGLVVVNVLGLERYLLGLREVPATWPMEALRAQAVAARTYAVRALRARARAGAVYGFDICATVECQVFAGAGDPTSPLTQRWARAVRSTAGQVLFFDGQPILARYHSTSGGHTLPNPEAFPGEPGFPYLRAVPSPHERASPLFRWEAVFSLGRLQRLAVAAGWWPRSARLRGVRTGDLGTGRSVVLRGAGRRVTLEVETFRDTVNQLAPQMWPRAYPGSADTPSGRLPATLPSDRLSVVTRAGTVRVAGRGWGHGVGMSQWGARGMAVRGAGSREILAHYYPGTRLRRIGPRRVEVGLAWGRRSLRMWGELQVSGPRGRIASGPGAWLLRPAPGGGITVRRLGAARPEPGPATRSGTVIAPLRLLAAGLAVAGAGGVAAAVVVAALRGRMDG